MSEKAELRGTAKGLTTPCASEIMLYKLYIYMTYLLSLLLFFLLVFALLRLSGRDVLQVVRKPKVGWVAFKDCIHL